MLHEDIFKLVKIHPYEPYLLLIHCELWHVTSMSTHCSIYNHDKDLLNPYVLQMFQRIISKRFSKHLIFLLHYMFVKNADFHSIIIFSNGMKRFYCLLGTRV